MLKSIPQCTVLEFPELLHSSAKMHCGNALFDGEWIALHAGKNIPGGHMSTLTLLTLFNTPAVVC